MRCWLHFILLLIAASAFAHAPEPGVVFLNEKPWIGLASLTNTPADSRRKLTVDYDWLGRRTRVGVALWTNSAWRVVVSNKFLYDGWSLAVELNATNNAVLRAYTWGLDLSGTLEGAGGVGGLLWVNDRTALGTNSNHFVAYDGNGNVSALIDAGSGNETARYEYGPFGDSIRATGPMGLANPIRFSSKYHDEATGLIYYGYRYYSPGLQRWLSRDPLGEQGGLNLYGFVGNDPIGFFDVNGEYTLREWLDIAGGFGEGWSDGAEIAWQSIRSPFEALGQTGGTLSTAYGRQQFAEMLQRLGPLVERLWRDECFRKQAIDELGDEFKAWLEGLQTVEGQSRLLSQGGTAAFLAAGSLTAKNTQWLQKLEQLARRLDRFTPDTARVDVTDFVSYGRRGGRVLASQELDRIQVGLTKHNVILRREADALIDLENPDAGALAKQWKTGPSEIYIRHDATRYELFHEIRHIVDRRKLTFDVYKDLPSKEREKLVYDWLSRQAWLTPEELRNAASQLK